MSKYCEVYAHAFLNAHVIESRVSKKYTCTRMYILTAYNVVFLQVSHNACIPRVKSWIFPLYRKTFNLFFVVHYVLNWKQLNRKLNLMTRMSCLSRLAKRGGSLSWLSDFLPITSQNLTMLMFNFSTWRRLM